jgi:hypothetical protein
VLFIRNFFKLIVLVLALLLAVNALTYLNFDFQYSFLRLKQKAIDTGYYLPFYYSHVLVGGLILVVGFFQLQSISHQRFKKVHRALGYFYVMGILFFAAPGGLVMSFFVGRGPWVLSSFVLQSVLWFYFTAVAFDRIRKRSIIAHQQWMWRSYALTFAAVTLRIYILLFSHSYNLNQPQSYALLAWLSWVPNLFVIEWCIRKRIIGKTSNSSEIG